MKHIPKGRVGARDIRFGLQPIRHRASRLHVVRDITSSDYTGLFLITSVTTVLVIRFFLWMTDYPQVGNDTLHIAHMLWGGLGMLIALIMLFIFIGDQWKWIAAFLGGMGFGAFIDELGKFITSDNNYFFQPTIALIYIIFLILYFATRELQLKRAPTETEYLANAIAVLNRAAIGTATQADQQRALSYLGRCDANDPLVKSVRRVLESINPDEHVAIGPYYRVQAWATVRYRRLVRHKMFQRLLAIWFLIDAIVSFALVIKFITNLRGQVAGHTGFVEWGMLLSTTASNVFIVIGLYALLRKKSRLEAYRWYSYALLTDILVTQVFMFDENQLSAIFILFFNLLVLAAVQISINFEETRRPATASTASAPAARAVASE